VVDTLDTLAANEFFSWEKPGKGSQGGKGTETASLHILRVDREDFRKRGKIDSSRPLARQKQYRHKGIDEHPPSNLNSD